MVPADVVNSDTGKRMHHSRRPKMMVTITCEHMEYTQCEEFWVFIPFYKHMEYRQCEEFWVFISFYKHMEYRQCEEFWVFINIGT